MAKGYLITVSSTTQPKECGPASEGFFIASWPDAEHDSPLPCYTTISTRPRRFLN